MWPKPKALKTIIRRYAARSINDGMAGAARVALIDKYQCVSAMDTP